MENATYTDTTRCKACGMLNTAKGNRYFDHNVFCSKVCSTTFTTYPNVLGQWWNNHHNYPQVDRYKNRSSV